MNNDVGRFRLGSATVTLLNAGVVMLGSLAEFMRVPESDPRFNVLSKRSVILQMQSVHIALPGASILVDAGLDDPSPVSRFRPETNWKRTSGIIAGLAEVGVAPETLTHVVMTHAHDDHFAGATVERGGQFEPRFPKARYFMGRADWEWVNDAALPDMDSFERDRRYQISILSVLEEQNRLELVDTDRDLVPGIRLIVAPGETPGHLVIRVSSEEHTLYCLGDLYHHEVEVEQPTWMLAHRDPAATIASRRRLVDAALAEDALLVAAHINGIGRLQQVESGVVWVQADLEEIHS